MKHLPLIAGVVAAALTVPLAAHAQWSEAVTSVPTDLRAGPGIDYPAVAAVGMNTPAVVYGCVSGWMWCDVNVQGFRGWLYGGDIYYPYAGGNYPVIQLGPTLALPIISFSLESYWGHWYHDRPFFRERGHWAHMGPPAPPPGRPMLRPQDLHLPPPGPGFHPGPGHMDPGHMDREHMDRDHMNQGRPGPEFHPGPQDHHDVRPGPNGPDRGHPGPGQGRDDHHDDRHDNHGDNHGGDHRDDHGGDRPQG